MKPPISQANRPKSSGRTRTGGSLRDSSEAVSAIPSAVGPSTLIVPSRCLQARPRERLTRSVPVVYVLPGTRLPLGPSTLSSASTLARAPLVAAPAAGEPPAAASAAASDASAATDAIATRHRALNVVIFMGAVLSSKESSPAPLLRPGGWLARGRSPGFRASPSRLPGSAVAPQWLTIRPQNGGLSSDGSARSQWRDRAGFAPDFP